MMRKVFQYGILAIAGLLMTVSMMYAMFVIFVLWAKP